MRILLILVLASIGCATHEISSTYEWEPEPSTGVEYSFHEIDHEAKTAYGLVGGVAFNYTPRTGWAEPRRSVRIKGGMRIEHGHSPRWWGEFGLRPHVYMGWNAIGGRDGTWSEFTGYARVGLFFDVGKTQMGPFFGIDQQVSNADIDAFGEHPRKPGLGLMFGWTLRW